MGVFCQRVAPFPRAPDVFVIDRYNGPTEWLIRVVQSQEAGIIRGNTHRESALMAENGAAFIGRQAENTFQGLQTLNTISHLPTPILPITHPGGRKKPFAELLGARAHTTVGGRAE